MSNRCTAEDVHMANPMTNNRERLIMIGCVTELSGCMRGVDGGWVHNKSFFLDCNVVHFQHLGVLLI